MKNSRQFYYCNLGLLDNLFRYDTYENFPNANSFIYLDCNNDMLKTSMEYFWKCLGRTHRNSKAYPFMKRSEFIL